MSTFVPGKKKRELHSLALVFSVIETKTESNVWEDLTSKKTYRRIRGILVTSGHG